MSGYGIEHAMAKIISAKGFRETLPASEIARSTQSAGVVVESPMAKAPWELAHEGFSFVSTARDERAVERDVVFTVSHCAADGELVRCGREFDAELVSKPIVWLFTSFGDDVSRRWWIGFTLDIPCADPKTEKRKRIKPKPGKHRFEFAAPDRVFHVSHAETREAVRRAVDGASRPTRFFARREDLETASTLAALYLAPIDACGKRRLHRAPSLVELRDRFGSSSGDPAKTAAAWAQLVECVFGNGAAEALRLEWRSSRFFETDDWSLRDRRQHA